MKEKIKKIFEGCGKKLDFYYFCLNCNKEVEIENIGYPISGDDFVCKECGEHEKDWFNAFPKEKGFKTIDKKCEKGYLCSNCKAKAKGYIQRTKEVEEIINNKLKDFIADNIQKDILEDLKEELQNKEIIKLGEENGLD